MSAATPSSSHPAGVFSTNAPNGYIGLVIYDGSGLAMRLEIRADRYSDAILPSLEEWVREERARHLQILE